MYYKVYLLKALNLYFRNFSPTQRQISYQALNFIEKLLVPTSILGKQGKGYIHVINPLEGYKIFTFDLTGIYSCWDFSFEEDNKINF